MKTVLSALLLLVLTGNSFNAAKADPCDSLEIIYVGFNPFDDEELIVYVQNTNVSEIFSYPGFKLVDNTGDTVAIETVNFFGIGQYSAHVLATTLEDYTPGTIFNGTLLLYTGFYDSLVCTFPVSEVLIPATGCTDFTVFSYDYLGGIDQQVHWSILDETGAQIFSGIHDYTADSIYNYSDSVCLDNGCYTLEVFSDNALENQLNFGMQFLSFNIVKDSLVASNDSIFSLDFSVYYCDSTTSIAEAENLDDFTFFPNPAKDVLSVEAKSGSFFIAEVYDITGKLLITKDIATNKTELDIATLSDGIYILQLITEKGIERRKFIKVSR